MSGSGAHRCLSKLRGKLNRDGIPRRRQGSQSGQNFENGANNLAYGGVDCDLARSRKATASDRGMGHDDSLETRV